MAVLNFTPATLAEYMQICIYNVYRCINIAPEQPIFYFTLQSVTKIVK